MKVHIDFESRSVVDIWKSGAWIYSTHPTTEILCVAYAVGGGAAAILEFRDIDCKANMHALEVYANNPDVLFYAHNAFFEQCMWKNIMVDKFGYPEIPIERWRCTAAKALAFNLPKALDKAAKALNLTEQKDNKGRQIMLKMCKPRKPRKNENKNKIYWYESKEDFAVLYKYCIQDVMVEREIDNRLPELSEFEQQVWFIDQYINKTGVHIDLPFVERVLKILEYHTYVLNKDLEKITEGMVTAGTQVAGMLKYIKSQGLNLPNLTKQIVSEAIQNGDISPKIIQVLRLRQELGKSSTAKYARMKQASDDKGIVRDTYMYCGASSTGRWSGKLVQTQNLPRGTKNVNVEEAFTHITKYGYEELRMIYPNNLSDVLSSCLRGVFCANKGRELYVVDYASIEARVLMWAAGEQEALQDFRNADKGLDEDIYVKMARRIYGNQTLTKKDSPGERQLGKQAILGCGYGVGSGKFKMMCEGYGIDISDFDAKRVVDLYRSTYHKVRDMWYAMDRTAMQTLNQPNTFLPCGRVNWFYNNKMDCLFMVLPSGRYLTYHHPRIGEGNFGAEVTYMTEVNSQWVRRNIYGAMFVENMVQAMSRDIMANAMVNLYKNQYTIVMHTHDELVCEVYKGMGDLINMIKLMCKLPSWAEGCPVSAEGFVTERYKK